MRVLGVRCSPRDFAYCLIEGTRSNPSLIHTAEVQFPQAYAKPLTLKWLMQEVDDLLKKHSVDSIALKSSEGLATRGKSFVERTEYETFFILVGALRGLKPIVKKVKAAIAKDLGFKGLVNNQIESVKQATTIKIKKAEEIIRKLIEQGKTEEDPIVRLHKGRIRNFRISMEQKVRELEQKAHFGRL